MAKEIHLTQGQVTTVDDWWYDELSQHKWQAHYDPKMRSFYAVRTSYIDGKKVIIMHSVIAGTPKGMYTDHINHDTLDNREENLRVCTCSQNQMNSKTRENNTTGYRGAYKKKNINRWYALIQVRKQPIYLGSYLTIEEAARAYDEAAKRLHGEYAKLNFPERENG